MPVLVRGQVRPRDEAVEAGERLATDDGLARERGGRGRDPGEMYSKLTGDFGEPVYNRAEAPATLEQKEMLANFSAREVRSTDLADETIQSVQTHAPGNGAPIGGLKVVTDNGWFAARPSGTENIYKIYAESFRGEDHLLRIKEEAQNIVNDALTAVPTKALGVAG